MNLFSSQLLALLGVPPLPPSVRPAQFNSTLTNWQLDALLRRRILENVDKSAETLGSIVQLVDQIENMPVGAGVRGDVQNALGALDKVSPYPSCALRVTNNPIYFRSSPRLVTRLSRPFCTPPKLSLMPPEHSSILACWLCYTFLRSTSMQCTPHYLQAWQYHSWQLSGGR
jgi:GPI-anchor transamidase subunit S